MSLTEDLNASVQRVLESANAKLNRANAFQARTALVVAGSGREPLFQARGPAALIVRRNAPSLGGPDDVWPIEREPPAPDLNEGARSQAASVRYAQEMALRAKSGDEYADAVMAWVSSQAPGQAPGTAPGTAPGGGTSTTTSPTSTTTTTTRTGAGTAFARAI